MKQTLKLNTKYKIKYATKKIKNIFKKLISFLFKIVCLPFNFVFSILADSEFKKDIKYYSRIENEIKELDIFIYSQINKLKKFGGEVKNYPEFSEDLKENLKTKQRFTNLLNKLITEQIKNNIKQKDKRVQEKIKKGELSSTILLKRIKRDEELLKKRKISRIRAKAGAKKKDSPTVNKTM